MIEDLDSRLDALTDLASKSHDQHEFFDAVIGVLFDAVPLQAVAIWSVEGGTYRLRHHAGLIELGIGTDTELQRLHEDALELVCQSTEKYLVTEDRERFRFHWYACQDASQHFLVFELVANKSEASQEWLLGLLSALGEITRDYRNAERTRELETRTEQLQRIQSVLLHLQQGDSVSETACNVVNEMANALMLDRVSYASFDGKSAKVIAISGIVKPEARAIQVRNLEQLAFHVASTQTGIQFPIDESNELGLEEVLQGYIDATHVEWLLAVPCIGSRNQHEQGTRAGKCFGVLVLENRTPSDHEVRGEMRSILLKHSIRVLERSVELESIPLRRVGNVLKRSTLYRELKRSRLYMGVGLLCLMLLALIVLPTTMVIESEGVYQPRELRHLYAPRGGEVVEVFANHQDVVKVGQPLLSIRSPELDLKLEELKTQRGVTIEKLRGIEAARLRDRKTSNGDQSTTLELSASERELQEVLRSQDEQLKIVQQTIASLQLVSPIDGKVINWNPLERLENRPVQQGQKLITVGAVEGPGVLHLSVREEDIRHVKQMLARGEKPEVKFAMANEPSKLGRGLLREIGTVTESTVDTTPYIRVVVDVSDSAGMDARPGASVRGAIHCERVSMGYAWTRKVWDYLCYHWW